MNARSLESRDTLREQDEGIHQDPSGDGWMLLRHADVSAVLRDHGRFSSEGLLPQKRTQSDREPQPSGNVIFSDPPTHTYLRGLISRAFTPRATKQLKPRIEALTAELLDATDHENVDLVAQLAAPLSVTVIAELLAIPAEDRASFSRWSDALAVAVSPVGSEDARAEAAPLVSDFNRYVRGLVAERRRHPGPDMLSSLLEAEADGRRLSDREAAEMALVLIAAGNETTTALISNGVDTLLAHPDQLNRLRNDHRLIGSALEEVLRFSPPVRMVFRRAVQDVTIGSAIIPRGSYVTLDIEAANRDPREFPDPASFDIARDPNRHLTFGAGIHFCVGAPLARLEAEVALLHLLETYSQLQPGTMAPTRVPFSHATGFSSYPVQLGRRASEATV